MYLNGMNDKGYNEQPTQYTYDLLPTSIHEEFFTGIKFLFHHFIVKLLSMNHCCELSRDNNGKEVGPDDCKDRQQDMTL